MSANIPTDLAPTTALTALGARAESALTQGRPVRIAAAAIGATAAFTALAGVLRDAFPVAFVAIVAAAGLLLLLRPFVGLVLAVLLSTTYGWVVVGADTSGFQILVLTTLAGLILVTRRELPARLLAVVRIRPATWLVLAIGWMVLAAFVRAGDGAFGYVRNYVGAFLFFVLVTLLASDERRRRVVVGAVVIGSASSAVIGLAQVLTTDALVSAWVLDRVAAFADGYERLASPWGLGSVASSYGKDVLVGFLLATPFALRRAVGRETWLGWALVGALALGLILSGSRSAWLGALLALGYLLVVSPLLRRPALLAMALLLAVCIARPDLPNRAQTWIGLPGQLVNAESSPSEHASLTPLPMLAGPSVLAAAPAPRQVGGERDETSVELSNNLRRRLTAAAVLMIADHPLFGVGPGAFKDQVDVYAPPVEAGALVDDRPELAAHNVVLELWADSGTPAVVAYVFFLAGVLLLLERRRRSSPGQAVLATATSAALIGLIVTSLFHNYQYDNLLWTLCGLAASMELRPATATEGPDPEPAAARGTAAVV